jgi:hypothetical protein
MGAFDQFIFRAVVLCKKYNKYVLKRTNAPLSYTKNTVWGSRKFGKHSLEFW